MKFADNKLSARYARQTEQCVEFIKDELPHWLLHPTVVRRMCLSSIVITPVVDVDGSRGNADWQGNVRLAANLARFRHTSPYTSPKGKTDISPIGVLAHELGHVVWYALERKPGKRKTWQLEWRSLHQMKKGSGISSYARRSGAEEDFAETHRLFVLNPKLLKELSPERFEFMQWCYWQLLGTVHPRRQFKRPKAEHVRSCNKLLSTKDWVLSK